jgi:hypothetical protein
MTQINWGILGQAGDPSKGVLEAYQQGRLLKQQRVRDDALAAYAQNPTADALRPLAAVDPAAYATLTKTNNEQDALRRAAQGRDAYAGYLRQHDPSAPPAAAVGASNAATTDANGDIVVTAKAPAAPVTPISIADVAQFDPEMAANLTKHVGDLDENGRKAFGQKTGTAAAVSLAASHLPLAERQAFIDDHAPLLREAGWSNDEIAGFDPHDDNLKGMIAIGVGADKIIADERAAAGQAVTVRGQDVSASTTRRGQDISASTAIRGQDIGAATARAGQAVAMRGQDMTQDRFQLTQRQKQNVTSKLTDLKAIEGQLNRAEAALNKTDVKGPWIGHFGGSFSGSANAADAALAGLSPLIRKLTRTPGEGSMSDYESRLAQAGLPSRGQSEEGRREAIQGLRDLIRTTRAGYEEMGGGSSSHGGQVSSTIRRVR